MSELSAKDLRELGRRYREAGEREEAARGTYTAGAAKGKAQADVDTPDDLRALISRVDTAKPASKDVEALRVALQKGGINYVAALTGRALVKELINGMAPSASARAVVSAEVEELQNSLGYREGSPVERALIDHIGVCWVRLQLAEHVLSSVTSGQHALSDGRYREMRVTEAQTRYLRALALLERLRRYAPNVQINIANQQVVQG